MRETPRGRTFPVEAAGIEPASASPSATASTCVVRDRVSSREGSRTTPYETSRVPGSRRVLVTRGSRRSGVTSPIYRRPPGDPRARISRGRATQIYAARAKPSLALEKFPVFSEAPGTSARFRGFRFTRRSRVAPLITCKATPYGRFSWRAAQVPAVGPRFFDSRKAARVYSGFAGSGGVRSC